MDLRWIVALERIDFEVFKDSSTSVDLSLLSASAAHNITTPNEAAPAVWFHERHAALVAVVATQNLTSILAFN